MNDLVTPGIRRRWIAIDHPMWIQAHASTVLPLGGGARLAAWFAGTREGTPDNKIWLARGTESGWSEPQVVAEGAAAHWNPVLAQGPDGLIWLFFKRGPKISEWRTWVRRSDDRGATWTVAEPLVAGDETGRGPVKNPPLVSEGRWLAPGSVEAWAGPVRWSPFVDVSDDHGATWTQKWLPLDHDALRGAGAIQPALWQHDDRVFALCRTSEGSAWLSHSDDQGDSWSPLQPTALVNNNSGLTVVVLRDGVVACVHNPVAGDWGDRCPLVVSISDDDGANWQQRVVIEDGCTPIDTHLGRVPSLPQGVDGYQPADGGVVTIGRGEYSYPGACVDGDELIVSYTWQRRGIVEARVPLTLLMPDDPAPEF